MDAKYSNLILWVIIILSVIGLIVFVAYPFITDAGDATMHFYARLFLVMFAVNTFAQLRLYNAIVNNTRFTIKLRETIGNFLKVLPGLDRSLKNVNSSLGNVKSSMDSLKKVMDSERSDKYEKV